MSALVRDISTGFLRLFGDLLRNNGHVNGTYKDADGYTRYLPVEDE